MHAEAPGATASGSAFTAGVYYRARPEEGVEEDLQETEVGGRYSASGSGSRCFTLGLGYRKRRLVRFLGDGSY